MRKLLLAAVAAAAVASPAYARDGSPYIGLEGGIISPENKDINGSATFNSTSVAQIGAAPIGRMHFKNGYDIDAIGGFDLGMFRVEGELGYKHSKVGTFNLTQQYLNTINNITGQTFTGNGLGWTKSVSVYDAMINGMIDIGDNAGWSGFAGGGVGYAHFKELGESDSSAAWQAFAGFRFPISDTIDAGVKYRYFRSLGRLKFADQNTFGGNVSGTSFVNTSQHFSSHSQLLSHVYKPPPPPPPPPPPATQTCPDGSVIPATSACPAPPPPPPPPPAPERGL